VCLVGEGGGWGGVGLWGGGGGRGEGGGGDTIADVFDGSLLLDDGGFDGM